jgi:hypothetical protein
MVMQVSLWYNDFISFGYIVSGGVAESYSSSSFSFLVLFLWCWGHKNKFKGLELSQQALYH